MPVKSKRNLYKLPVKNDDTDIVVKMKTSHGDLFGLEPLAPNDPLLLGQFASGVNVGKKFLKNAGGFRFESYKLVAKSTFTVNEVSDSGASVAVTVKSLDIGLPRGAAVNKFMSWVAGLSIADDIDVVITPNGTSRGIPSNATP